jgi:diguanylate cyclase (GGDEF)-like protein
MATQDRADYTALGDRMVLFTVLRLGMAAVVVIWAAVRPELVGVSIAALVAGVAAYVALALIAEPVRRELGRRGNVVIGVMLLLDGVALAVALYATGGTQSPMRFLIYLHLVAVSLLCSYRTGLKVALWDSLLLFVVLYAQAAALVPAIDVMPGRTIEFDRMPVLNVTSFWLFALATSVFSAMNERELRHRRADLETLVELGSKLDDVTDPIQQSQIVLDGLAARFDVERGVVLGASDGRVVVLAAIGVADLSTEAEDVDAVVALSWARKDLLPVRRLDPARNPVLTRLLPGARNVLVSPLVADGRPLGAVVIEYRPRPVLGGVERRVASVLTQLSSIASLNLRNAALLRHVQDLAERDSLTGAANRRMFEISLERVLTPPERRTGRRESMTAVLFLDLDDFKIVNDSLGHAAGDALLVAVTERIAGSVRDGDLVARLGGDEFAVLTEDTPDLKRSMAMAERLVRELRAPYLIGDQHVSVTASIGIASARDASDLASDIVRNADVAMYMAKANGKAGFAIFDPGMHAAIRDRHELGTQLQSAAELGQLRLAYQPIVSLETGKPAGLEALVRWQHPERGMVSPVEFIEIAEENGAILPIGRWVLQEACRSAVRWGLDRAALFLCVNVSAREIQQPDFVLAVEATLAEAGLPPSCLHLEITETALLKATPSTIATLEALRRLGVRVVIDDFGTGYFSLSHLRQFPVDALKIALEFVQVPDSDSRSAALAGAIVAMSDSLGITTVAEGIEEAGQAERMLALGCTYGQGYFFARPMAADEVPAIIGEAAKGRSAEAADRVPGAPERRAVRLPRPAASVDVSPA